MAGPEAVIAQINSSLYEMLGLPCNSPHNFSVLEEATWHCVMPPQLQTRLASPDRKRAVLLRLLRAVFDKQNTAYFAYKDLLDKAIAQYRGGDREGAVQAMFGSVIPAQTVYFRHLDELLKVQRDLMTHDAEAATAAAKSAVTKVSRQASKAADSVSDAAGGARRSVARSSEMPTISKPWS